MTEPLAAPLASPGWYPDPEVPGQERYWAGSSWTDQARGVGSVATREHLPIPERVPLTGTPLLPGFHSLALIGISEALRDIAVVTADNMYEQSGYALRLDGTIVRWQTRTALISPVQQNSFEEVRFVTEELRGIGRAVDLVRFDEDAHLALLEDGTVWQWRTDFDAEAQQARPVAGLQDVRLIRSTPRVSSARFVVDGEGQLWAWGSGYSGLLGLGDQNDRESPAPVPGIGPVVDVKVGFSSVTALGSDGTVWAWGRRPEYELEPDEQYADGERLSPLRVAELPPVIGLGEGDTGFDEAGAVWSWSERVAASQVDGLSAVVDIRCGWDTNTPGWPGTYYAITSRGELWAWGSNSHGQVGDGTTEDRESAVRVVTPDSVIAIAATSSIGYALTQDGQLLAWGGVGYRDAYGPSPTRIALPAPRDAAGLLRKWGSMAVTWLGSSELRRQFWDLRDGRTILMVLCGATDQSGATLSDEILLALRHGADVDATDDDGDSALFYAASKGNVEAVRLLLDFGASPDLPPARHGTTAVLFAALASLPTGTPRAPGRTARDYRDIAISLLRAGADPGQLYDRNISLVRYTAGGILQIQRHHVASYLSFDDLEFVLMNPNARW